MPKFQVLYLFTNHELTVLEIKRTDRPKGSPPSDIYKWLVIPLKLNKAFELDFKTMSSNKPIERREFMEGELEFNDEGAKLNLLSKIHKLDRKNPEAVPEKVISLIQNHLSKHRCNSFRELRPADVHSFKEWLFDPDVIRYSMTKFHRLTNQAQVMDWFHATLFDPKTFQLGLLDPETGKLIGYAGIASLNEIDGNGEYFIFIGDKSYWGRGIASSVTKEIVKMGFQELKLHRIFLTASNKNPGAIRAYEKAGFVHEGKMREAFFRNGEYSDKVIMGILESEFEREQI